jgi:TatD DNase family protein
MIDVGVNLTHPRLANTASDLNQLVASSRNHGLKAIIAIGTNLTESERLLEMAKRFPGYIFVTVGVHPHYAGDMQDDDWSRLDKIVSQPEVVAVGEMGLDFYRNFSPHTTQIKVFERQLAANQVVQKPLYLHERDAFSAQLDILRSNSQCYTSGIAHCFTGDTKALKAYLDLDFYIGVTGWICDERRGNELAEAVKYIPKERLLVETDSPFLLPRTLRPKPKDSINRPWFVNEVVSKVARCRNETTDAVASYTTRNANALFRLTSYAD